MKKLLTGLIAIIIIAGCSKQPQMDMRVVAKAGEQEFTLYDLETYLYRSDYKDSEAEFKQKSTFLEQHLDKMITSNAGVKLGLLDSVEVDSGQVDRILYQILYMQEVTDKMNVTPQDVKKFWDKYGGEVHVAQIVVSDKDLADSLYNELQKDPDKFDEFVMDYSEDATKETNHGDLDWRRVTNVPDEIRDGIFSLQPGQLSRPLKSNIGYHITKMLGKQKNTPEDYESEKGNYRVVCSIYERGRLQKKYGDYIKGKLHFKFYEDNYKMVAGKALANREKDGNLSRPLSFYIGPEDLTEEEAQLPIFTADDYVYSASGFIADLKKYYYREGVNFDNMKIAESTLDLMTIPKLMAIYGKKIGLENDPRFKRQYMDSKLGSVYYMMQKDYLLDTVDVTEQEIEERYEQRKKYDYREDEQIKVAEIQLNTEQEAKEVLSKLNSGVPFAELVKNTTRSGFDKTGGNLGYCTSKRFAPAYFAARGKKIGQYAGPFKFDDKWSVIKITDIKPERLKPLSEVKGQIRSFILGGKKYDVYHKWLDEQKKKVENFIDYDLVRSTLKTKDF